MFGEYPSTPTSRAPSTPESHAAAGWIQAIGLREFQAARMRRANNDRQGVEQIQGIEQTQGAEQGVKQGTDCQTYAEDNTTRQRCSQNSSVLPALQDTEDMQLMANKSSTKSAKKNNSTIYSGQTQRRENQEEPNTANPSVVSSESLNMQSLPHQKSSSEFPPTVLIASELHLDSYNPARGRPLGGVELTERLETLANVCGKIDQITK